MHISVLIYHFRNTSTASTVTIIATTRLLLVVYSVTYKTNDQAQVSFEKQRQKRGSSIAHAQCYNEEVDVDTTQWSSSLRYFTIFTPLQFRCRSSEGRDKITNFKSLILTHIMSRCCHYPRNFKEANATATLADY